MTMAIRSLEMGSQKSQDLGRRVTLVGAQGWLSRRSETLPAAPLRRGEALGEVARGKDAPLSESPGAEEVSRLIRGLERGKEQD